jgi:hypothetical protein
MNPILLKLTQQTRARAADNKGKHPHVQERKLLYYCACSV